MTRQCQAPGCTNPAMTGHRLCAACLSQMEVEHYPPPPAIISSLEDLERDFVGDVFSAANRHDPALVIRRQQRTIQECLAVIRDMEHEIAVLRREKSELHALARGLERQRDGLRKQLQAYINGAALTDRDARRAEQQDGGLFARIRRLVGW